MKSLSYRDFLLNLYEQKKNSNSSYSLNAFSRDAGLRKGEMSNILNKHSGFSQKRAIKVLDNLNVTDREQREIFILMVDVEHARSASLRKLARKKLEKLISVNHDAHYFSDREMGVLTHWHFTAICELSLRGDFQANPDWIAKKIGVSLKRAEECLDLLYSNGVLTDDHGKTVYNGFNLSTNEIPSDVLKKYHKSVMEKAMEFIETEGVKGRDITSISFSAQKKDIIEIKRRIRAFRHELARDFESLRDETSVYCLSVQFFDMLDN